MSLTFNQLDRFYDIWLALLEFVNQKTHTFRRSEF